MKKKPFIIGLSLLGLALIFTILVKIIDVQAIGPESSSVGFATINQTFFSGFHPFWYDLTEFLGLIPLLIAAFYTLIGLRQLIQRKSLKKVDKNLLILGAFYVLIAALYIFFEKIVINYRPLILDGELEASFPSSHTLIAIFVCGSAIMLNPIKNLRAKKITNLLLCLLLALIVLGRLLSGVHWLTDIIGGSLYASALLCLFRSLTACNSDTPVLE